MRVFVVVMLLLAGCSSNLKRPPGASGGAFPETTQSSQIAEQEVRQFMREWEESSRNNDAAWFERHYADSFIKTDQQGKVVDKKDQVDGVKNDPRRSIASSSVDDLKIQTFGPVAVVTFRVTVTGVITNGPYNVKARATSVLVKREGLWQLVAHHASDIAGEN